MAKLWAGRTAGMTDKIADDFNSSIHFDCKMYQQDIEGSMAHAAMLGAKGILSADEAQALIDGLDEILNDLQSGALEFDLSCEDIHMFVEQVLTERLGDLGKKLHTARSRNDQVALDLRMYLRAQGQELLEQIYDLLAAIEQKAEAERYKREQDAIAKRIEQEQKAEADKLTATAKRFADEEEAKGIEAKGKAEAQAILAKAEAMKAMGEASILEMYLKVLPDVVKSAAEPLAQTDKIVMYGDGNATKIVKDVMNSASQVTDGLAQSTGIDIKSLIDKFVNKN